ncbi:GNAT family N-acetyltransferase [Herbiconiux sp. CPCC 205716]|uniref:GNAT family N-acetyltransferase n=1 Tax=Herbiconiux gentiana TaxID=2970912 RepID=A0ABT2GJA8_9MICO|nr:GNAT family N-acetyltransferase [Herbiconiux gentiana]MCS5716294.1 GNAT family N-acetyltransferase [Herbiconiux gentiana]
MIRGYVEGDAAATLEVFERAILETARSDYSEEQVRAWLGGPRELARWNAERLATRTVVDELDGAVAGFSDLGADGYVDRLFVHPSFARRGAAARLLDAVVATGEDLGLAELTTHASLVARPVFERAGFDVVHRETVERGALTLDRFFMRRMLGDG